MRQNLVAIMCILFGALAVRKSVCVFMTVVGFYDGLPSVRKEYCVVISLGQTPFSFIQCEGVHSPMGLKSKPRSPQYTH